MASRDFSYDRQRLNRKAKLLGGYDVAGRQRPLPFQCLYSQIQEIFCRRFTLQSSDIHFQIPTFLGRDLKSFRHRPDSLAILLHLVNDSIFVKVCEIKPVRYADNALRKINWRKPYVLICVFHLRHRRMGRTVGSDYTVAIEIPVAGGIDSEVASISPIFSAVFIRQRQALVNPIPYKSALQIRIAVDMLPLQGKIAVWIAHCVGILWRGHRAVASLPSDFFKPCSIGILRHIHVGIPFPLCPFVADGTIHPTSLPLLNI